MGATEALVVGDKPVRTVTVRQVPPGVDHKIKSLGLTKLTPEDEKMALARCHGHAGRAVYEQTLQALRQVNGEPVSFADGTAARAMEEMDPKLRNATQQWYAELHVMKEDDLNIFQASEQVQILT